MVQVLSRKILTVVVVIALLSIAFMWLSAPNFLFGLDTAESLALRSELVSNELIIERFKEEIGDYPNSLAELVPEYLTKLPLGACMDEINYKYPGHYNPESFDLWFDQCTERSIGRISNW